MALGERLKEARDAAEMTQLEFGFEVNMSRSAIGMIEIDKRKLPREVTKKAVEVLDDGFFAMAAAEEAVGYSWVPKLDGEAVDLHRASVTMKTQEELHEALEAIRRVCVVNHPKNMDKYSRA
ncbi:helix-turn-helix transcriptional regulator, partial [Aneurinibacillus thermoaerophilus]|uniref:helix-turn-helix domain-containing protein n=1 Tax=Aneurinibacillus thermoaerophilus TaxID=143495 RepID=UPI002E2174BF|nr:helix-turn-helix transcriptional regulator [Aneurinibacillus thermoaerophilus]